MCQAPARIALKRAQLWARVKDRTEKALLRLPFRAVYLFRPGVIQPLHGDQSRTGSHRIFYSLLKPVLPLLRMLIAKLILTTESVGRAMLAVAHKGAGTPLLEASAIAALDR